MISIYLFLQMISSDKPVIRLDEVIIEGNIRKPALVEISGSKLNERVEEIALSSLIRLENELLKSGSLPKKTKK